LAALEENYRLDKRSGGLGPRCEEDGVWLADVPLLRKTNVGLAPRSFEEIGARMKGAYGREADAIRLASGLRVAADALNRGDIGRAMIATVLMRLPELNDEGALGIARADEILAKYNPDEPRDARGRWTTGAAAPPRSSAPPASTSPSARSWEGSIHLHGGQIIPVQEPPAGIGDNIPPLDFTTDGALANPGKPGARTAQGAEPASPPLGYIPGDPNYPMNYGVRWPEATHDLILQALKGKNPNLVIFVPLHGEGPIRVGPELDKDYPCPEGYLAVRLIGIPQVTRPVGRRSYHAYDSVDEALALAKTKQFGTIYFNRAWSSLTNGEVRSRIQRDVVAVKLPGLDMDAIYHPVEVLSPGQTKEQQERRMDPDPRIAPLRTRRFRESSYGRSPYFEYFDAPSNEA
jgi:hypothetical protein